LIERKLLLENLLRLRSRIEDWTQVHGWESMDYYREKKDGKGRIVWKLSDWEFVDNMYKAVYNGPNGFGNDYSFDKETVRTWNKMWKRYKNDYGLIMGDNPNLKPDWDQIQQMEWDEVELAK